ncbi:MAG TPA: cytochrome c oxidase subunit II [Streptosporangiaceae bacterium]|nr:cytochrome c oxidase subunit II [Streptosporangiaceae bacterium]
MSHSSSSTTTARAAGDARHGLRIFLIWLPLAVIADLLIWFAWYPHMPPGRMSDQAQGQQFDIAVMAMLAAPVLLFVWVYFAYALIVWRRRPGDDEDGPPLHGNTRIQATWITATAVIVLGLFVFGTVQLIVPAGAGAGEGPTPAWRPSTTNLLQVQVIGQQWAFTYRFPQFGGMETTQLLLPEGQQVQFNVTSLDVIHSFWAYQLGVKADANPGVNNIAFAKPQQLGSFSVRCNELCGIWHGAMFNYGRVVTPAAFQVWARGLQAREQRIGLLADLPRYALTYDPTVIPQLGKDIVKVAGITGANGYYYPSLNQSGDPGDPTSP